jgi:hypothetical protein
MGRRANRLAGALVVTRQRLAIAGGVAALALALVLVLTLRDRGSAVATPREPVEGATQLSRSGTLFADPMRASVQVVVDRRRVDPAQVGFTTNFEPYVRVGLQHVTRHDTGQLTRLEYSVELICLTNICLSKDKPAPVRVQFPPAEVFYVPKSGGRRTLRLSWTATTIGPRTSEADLSGSDPFLQPSWRATTDPLAVSYATSPHTLRTVLFVASGLLLAFGLLALVRFVTTGRLRLRILSPLERAVVLVERAPDDAPEKRKALELLSRELARTGEPDLALAARELAWAEPTPLPTLTQPLTLDVRRVIEQRSNGHAAA